jgi:hypothetical protein
MRRGGTEVEGLSGGLPDDADLCVLEPEGGDPFFGENHALWIWDDEHRIGLHLYLKTLGHVTSFHQRRETIYAFLPGGAVLTSDQDGPGPEDRRVARGPNLVCECIEPFRRWRFRYDSTARRTSAAEMREGLLKVAPPVALAFDIEVTTALPPWVLGTYSHGEQVQWARQFFGTSRYEQLLEATGEITTAEAGHQVSAAGMRTHRVGHRNTGSFPGHSWATALFPDGRSFGLQKFCGADGTAMWQEAWVSDGGERLPAEILAAPLFSGQLPGESLGIELESALGHTSIQGTLRATNFVTTMQPDPQKFLPGLEREGTGHRVMSQGLACYEWDGERGTGMIERSVRVDTAGSLP